MTEPKLHKVFSILLAVLILLSAFSFSVDTRLCSTVLSASVSSTKVKSCCSSSFEKVSKVVQDSCCQNKLIYVDGLNQFDGVSVSLESPSLEIFEVVTNNSVNFVNYHASNSFSYPNYIPPNLVMEPQIEYQTFLI